jgi:outer membrane protein assembly factor BamB
LNRISTLIIILTIPPLLYLCSIIMPVQEQSMVAPLHMLVTNNQNKVLWEIQDIRMRKDDFRTKIIGSAGLTIIEGVQGNSDLLSIIALNSLDGKIEWQKRVSPNADEIIVHDEILYLGTNGVARVQAYDISEGNLLWETSLPQGHSVSELYSQGNKIFVLTSTDKFFVLSDQGEILETYHNVLHIYMKLDDIVYQKRAADIEAVQVSSQKMLWNNKIDLRFTYSPVFYDGSIYLQTSAIPSEIYSINQFSGKINWKVTKDVISNLCISGEKVYFLTSESDLVILGRYSGDEIAKLKFSPAFDVTSQISGYYVAFDPETNVLVVSFGDNMQVVGLKIDP